jgi:hypothetical protein
MLWRPWLHPGQPNRSESDSSRTKDIIDGIIPHKPCVQGRTAKLGERMCENPWIGLLHLHGFGNHDRGQITANRQLLDLGLLEPHLPIGDNPKVNAQRVPQPTAESTYPNAYASAKPRGRFAMGVVARNPAKSLHADGSPAHRQSA